MIAATTFHPSQELAAAQTPQDPTAVIKGKAKAASQKFEAMFLNSMFQEMFTGADGDGPMGGPDTVAYVCGPERMMQATVEALQARGLRDDRIFVSLERHMECGVGLCGHCQLGEFFVCRDGPVFSVEELGPAFTLEGL